MFKDQIVRYKVVYDRKKEAVKKGKAMVQIEAYQNGNRRYFSTGIYLTPDQWNQKRNEPKEPYLANQVRSLSQTELYSLYAWMKSADSILFPLK